MALYKFIIIIYYYCLTMTQQTKISFWINFGYVAGHIAALIIVSIQHQLRTNERKPYPAKVRAKIRQSSLG